MDRDFRVSVRVRNARILRLVEGRGFKSLANLCDVFGLNYMDTAKLVALKSRPVTRAGDWSKTAFELATALGREPEELWPQYLRHVTYRGTIQRDMSADELRGIPAPEPGPRDLPAHEVTRLLSCLSPREERVMRLRYGIGGGGESTLAEIGEDMGFSKDRAHQIEARSLKRLRQRIRALAA